MAKQGFHDVLFPLKISLGARGGPETRTDVVELASGGEVRRSRWSGSLRSWDVSGGIKSFTDAEEILSFFEARQGQAFGFRFRDPIDSSSASAGNAVTAFDVPIGVGDGSTQVFPLVKTYGPAPFTVVRAINCARNDSLKVAVGGTELSAPNFVLSADDNAAVLVDPPAEGLIITAGFLFDVPVRFGEDQLLFEVGAAGASVPSVTLREVRL